MEDKKQIRSNLITKRDSLESNIWNANSNIIQRTIIQSEVYKHSDCILCYADFHGEVATVSLVEDAFIKGKHVYMPKVLENFTESRMEFYEVFSTVELINGYKGIREPVGDYSRSFASSDYANSNVLMLIPGVAFSTDGYRLGYGKGYYDFYLKDKPNIIKMGLCFSMQMVESIPVYDTDIKMDFIVNEKTTLNMINERFR